MSDRPIDGSFAAIVCDFFHRRFSASSLFSNCGDGVRDGHGFSGWWQTEELACSLQAPSAHSLPRFTYFSIPLSAALVMPGGSRTLRRSSEAADTALAATSVSQVQLAYLSRRGSNTGRRVIS